MSHEKCGILFLREAGKPIELVLLLLAGLMLLVACEGKNAADAKGSDKEGLVATTTIISPLSGSNAPKVEAVLTIPAIEKGSEGLLVVYRDTHIGYMESYGADTFIYRFTFLPGGWIDGATLYERGMGGEKATARFSFSYAGEVVQVFESAGKESKELASVKLSPDYLELKARTLGTYAFPEKGKIVYTEREPQDTTGAEAMTVSIWVDGKKDYRFRTEGIEPINEVYASGLMDALAGDKGPLNLVLIDLVLGPSRNIKPALAYALSESKKISP